MSGSAFFRGTSLGQDSRFTDTEQKLLKRMKFPKSFSQKVNMKKVNKQVMQQWITEKVTEILGFEDEIVTSLVGNSLEEKEIDPKKMQLAITGFLEKKAAPFMEELWALLLSAQENTMGIPQQFIDKKKEELRLKKEEEARQAEEIRRRIEQTRVATREEKSRGSQRSELVENGDRVARRNDRDADRGRNSESGRHKHRSYSRDRSHSRDRKRSKDRSNSRDRHTTRRHRSRSRSRGRTERHRSHRHSYRSRSRSPLGRSYRGSRYARKGKRRSYSRSPSHGRSRRRSRSHSRNRSRSRSHRRGGRDFRSREYRGRHNSTDRKRQHSRSKSPTHTRKARTVEHEPKKLAKDGISESESEGNNSRDENRPVVSSDEEDPMKEILGKDVLIEDDNHDKKRAKSKKKRKHKRSRRESNGSVEGEKHKEAAIEGELLEKQLRDRALESMKRRSSKSE